MEASSSASAPPPRSSSPSPSAAPKGGGPSTTGGDLLCPICLDFASDAVESICCATILCSACVHSLQKRQCPMCRTSPLQVVASKLARKMIGNMPAQCSNVGCGFKSTRSEMQKHYDQCELTKVKCKSCKQVMTRNALSEHAAQTHLEDLWKGFQELLPDEDAKGDESKPKWEPNMDRIGALKNSRGYEARLGANGKYYCGQPKGFQCKCCTDVCGPENGCNCASCMELDLVIRGIEPKTGRLVNQQGAMVRKGRSDGSETIYCGRYMKPPGTDGYCGPTNGNNCVPCKILQSQIVNGPYSLLF